MSRKKDVGSDKSAKSPLITTKTTRRKKTPDSAIVATKVSESSSRTTISREERDKMIAQTAYFRAEQRGFTGGNPIEDWLWAETEVDKQLKAC